MPKLWKKNCGTCALYDPNNKVCHITNFYQGQYEPDDYCSKHLDSLIRCEKCGGAILKDGSFVALDADNKPHIYCGQCI